MIIANKINLLEKKSEVKDSIENLFNDFRENKIKGHPFNWNVYRVGIYGLDNNINTYLLYETQGIPEALYNSTFDWDIDLTEDAEEYSQFETSEEGKEYLSYLVENTFEKIIDNVI